MISIGIDTSNYTTSAALYDSASGRLWQQKQLLPVKAGEMGLRQSDAVFHHTRQLPEMVERLMAQVQADGGEARPQVIGVSTRPCAVEGSYMPCFLAGCSVARSLGAVLSVPVRAFSHQQGHVAAAAYGAGRTDLLQTPLLAFHVSGGTTEVLHAVPHADGPLCTRVGGSLDLKAGQLIDRVGGMLGLPFPAGPALEELALLAEPFAKADRPRATLDGANCHLSGVENQCRRLMERGETPARVALYCLLAVYEAVAGMTAAALEQCGELPVLYAGGVMSNSLLRERLTERFSGVFAPPAFSADNAAGIAWLSAHAGA